MGALALGASALLAAVLLLRWFVGADPKALVKGLRWFGAGALLLVAVGLAALDRVALALFAASLAWGLFTGGVVWPWPWPYRYRASSAGRPPDDTKTRVQTEWLDMELDHASGNTTGRVLKGDFEGDLENLTAETGRKLYRDLNAADSASARLLEAYLDRRFGDAWRVSSGAADSPAGDMTRNEALAVLGLSAGATNEDIRAAHRRLILQNHPDHGGSGYLAAKINQAKDVLLAD